ncbi:hypothetical protein [Shewanella frigidimarina]|uniref:DUF4875 domain-containing protein n=1 Tax=Shewanella frigidimarina TaxID=56812 RepID=UPI003D7BC0E6
MKNNYHLIQSAVVIMLLTYSGTLTNETSAAFFAGCVIVSVGYLIRYLIKERYPKVWLTLKFAVFTLLLFAVVSTAMNPNAGSNKNKMSKLSDTKQNKLLEDKQDKSWPLEISSLVVYAKPYSVIQTEDYSFSGRKRIKWFISVPDANTYDTYLGTAIKAAKDLAINNRVNQANVIIEPSPKLVGLGYNLAIVTYTVDGKGNAGDAFDGEYWQAQAVKIPPEPLRIKVAEIWYESRSNFQNADGMTDEPSLTKFISSKLNIPESEVRMPWVDQVKLVM